jgi:hypothetical protein
MRRFEERLISKAYSLVDMPQGRFKHFSFLVQRTTPICVGWNWKKTHTISEKYRFQSLHSEGHCILSFPHDRDLLHNYSIYNIRINNIGRLALASPCPYCQILLKSYGIRDIFFTNDSGNFEKMTDSFNFKLSADNVTENFLLYMEDCPNDFIKESWGNNLNEAFWPSHERNMKKISLKFPNIIFTLRGEDQNNGNVWVKYFKEGKMHIAATTISFEKFNSKKLVDIK